MLRKFQYLEGTIWVMVKNCSQLLTGGQKQLNKKELFLGVERCCCNNLRDSVTSASCRYGHILPNQIALKDIFKIFNMLKIFLKIKWSAVKTKLFPSSYIWAFKKYKDTMLFVLADVKKISKTRGIACLKKVTHSSQYKGEKLALSLKTMQKYLMGKSWVLQVFFARVMY